MQRSSLSRHSLTSSLWPSSPPVIASMRPSELHRRGVSFEHIRRTSTTSALTPQGSRAATPATPRLPDNARDLRTLRALESVHAAATSSPTVQAAQAIRSRKDKASLHDMPRIKARKAETPGQHMRSDIRKHSAELEKACEEAFFRSSVGSGMTVKTSTTETQSSADTPPSSVSVCGSGASPPPLKQQNVSRPLPDVPKDTPNTYLTRTLEETRDKLAAYKTAGEDNTAKFDEVMKMLENIMPTGLTPPPHEKRSFTAPEARTPDHLGFLPMISEESDQRSSRDGTVNWHRSVTSPAQLHRQSEDRTIKILPPSSPGTVAPLNVRKRSNGSEASDETIRRLSMQRSHERLTRKRTNEHIGGLTVIDEDSTLPATPTFVRKKKSGWFGLVKKPDMDSPTVASISYDDLDNCRQRKPSRVLTKDKALPAEPPLSAQSSELPIRKKRFGQTKGGFGKWLGRKAIVQEDADVTDVGESLRYSADASAERYDSRRFAGNTTFSNTTHSLDSLFSTASPTPSSNDGPPTSDGAERSWFARFFHIKPAVKVLCFSIPRGRARQELVLLFKEWQRHGVRDLAYSRETNTITARVDKQNSLDIKGVTFRIEMFVVLEHGRKVGLSIARFVQVKGAASGFRRVLEVVDGVMRGRGWMVEDEEKWKALCEVVGG